jgi:hypothetical protein
MRIETEVQRRVQERTSTKEFEASVQTKLDAEIESHLSVLKVELEMKKKKLIDEFKEKTETEERSKQELEEIIRTNARKVQAHQKKDQDDPEQQEETTGQKATFRVAKVQQMRIREME